MANRRLAPRLKQYIERRARNNDVKHDPVERQPNWPWLFLILILGLGLAGLVLFTFNRHIPVSASWGAAGGPRNGIGDLFNTFQQGVISPVVACVFGILIIRKQPLHRIGWLLIAIGAIMALSVLLAEWAVRGYLSSAQDVLGAPIAAWATNWIWIVLMSLVFLMIAVFPSGKFLSNRWRAVYAVCALLFLAPGFIAAATETPMSSAFQIVNPFVRASSPLLYNLLFTTAVAFMVITTIVILTGTGIRYRRGLGVERSQIKWLLAGVALFAVMVVIGLLLVFDTIVFQVGSEGSASSVRGAIGAFIVNATPLAVLVGIGIAMVRHQLYDIDFLIRRTTSYAILTGLLAFIYFSSVVLLQQILSPLTGESTPAVVLSTLLIAALFLPVRRRVQELIDRRFYRRKYDAQRTLEQFAATVRDETDLDALTAELLRVIQETMQPEHVAIWLRPVERMRTTDDGRQTTARDAA
jgi:hypothetical protein